jgi:hypothetical protein
MRYLVKATAQGNAYWLTSPRLGGNRTFAGRQLAERFETEAQAMEAAGIMRSKEDCRGIMFTIEAVDQSAGTPPI